MFEAPVLTEPNPVPESWLEVRRLFDDAGDAVSEMDSAIDTLKQRLDLLDGHPEEPSTANARIALAKVEAAMEALRGVVSANATDWRP